jgi:glycosyltransferase involved in cell wall biosynthesis
MMHILLLAPAIGDYCVEYANALSTRAKVTMFAPSWLFGPYARFVDKAVDFHLLNWPRQRSLANLLFVPRLVGLIEDLRPNIVHFMFEGIIWLNLAVPYARKYGLVTTMHDVSYHPGDWASRRWPRWCVGRLATRSDKIIVHGAILKREAELRYPQLIGRIEVLPHIQLRRYFNLASKDRLDRNADPSINILFFGRIFPYKGLDFLIRSVPMVTSCCDNVRVIIAGQGENIDRYRSMMMEPRFFDIRSRRISDRETAQLFTDADIVVLPYIEASQSGVLAIANTFGKPVIVTDVGELPRSVEHEVTGIVVPAKNERALADAIIRLVMDPSLRVRLGEAGRAAAERSASPEVIAEKALNIYEHVAEIRQMNLKHPATEADMTG